MKYRYVPTSQEFQSWLKEQIIIFAIVFPVMTALYLIFVFSQVS